MNKLLETLNPLRELNDYEQITNVSVGKKLSLAKLEEIMYYPQKAGEKWIQAKQMVAIMLHEGYLTKDGNLTEKFNKAEPKELQQLVDKIQRIIDATQGRYSQQDAATLSQEVWYRALSQFRKWLPSFVESRFSTSHYDLRLQTQIEGRYLTLGSKVAGELIKGNFKQAFTNMFLPLISFKQAIKDGNLTESQIANMRKNLFEITLLLGTLLAYGGLKGGDDDKKWRKKPAVKLGLTLLNRVSGDISTFYSPTQGTQIAKNAIPMTKLIDDLVKVGTVYLPYAFYIGDYNYKRGSNKGYNKEYKTIRGLIPGVKTFDEVRRIANTELMEENR